MFNNNNNNNNKKKKKTIFFFNMRIQKYSTQTLLAIDADSKLVEHLSTLLFKIQIKIFIRLTRNITWQLVEQSKFVYINETSK